MPAETACSGQPPRDLGEGLAIIAIVIIITTGTTLNSTMAMPVSCDKVDQTNKNVRPQIPASIIDRLFLRYGESG